MFTLRDRGAILFVSIALLLLPKIATTLEQEVTKSDSQNKCNCGSSTFGSLSCGGRNGRVIGGREALPKEIPWQVSLETCSSDGICEGLCGGSIIGRRYILTAAHCFHYPRPNLRVVLGTVDMGNSSSGGSGDSSSLKRIMRVASLEINEHWDPVGAKGDIALLRLKDSMEFSESIRPVCLPSGSGDLYVQKPAMVSGWGYTSEDSFNPSTRLRRALLYITSNADVKCRNTDHEGKALSKEYLCAHGVDADACHMDSGGPLTVSEGNKCILAGIISYGRGCARKDFAGVYTRVSEYLDWIRRNTDDDDCLNSA